MTDQVTRQTIINKLKQIEVTERVKILLAVESGSRGWGFASLDSDYDVRFIYAHSPEWYLSIVEVRDVLEYPIAEELDINGWDIKKALKLFRTSNPPLYEWLQSPIIYLEQGLFARDLRKLIPEYYSQVAMLHHYFHMAQGNYKDYLLGDKVKIKKYFYVLRPVFACMWMKKYHSAPPMEFEKTMKLLDLSKDLTRVISKLLLDKRSGLEMGEAEPLPVLDNFIRQELKNIEDYLRELPKEEKTDINLLNKIFRMSIDYWDSRG